MKKAIVIALVLVLAVSLFAGCSNETTETIPTDNAAETNESTDATESTDTTESTETTETETTESLMTEPLTFKVTYTESADTPLGQIFPEAFDKISEMTNGDLQFEYYPDAQLGSIADYMEQISSGAPIIGTVGYDSMSASVEEAVSLAIPYVFENVDEVFTFATTDYSAQVDAKIEEAGFVPLCHGSLGVRHFISTKPINSADDIKGMIVRMGASEPCQNFITVMGGTPATTAWADNYSMLQNGSIDACEAALSLEYASSLYEVCDYLSLSGHLSTPFMFVIAPAYWEQIPAEYQEIMKDVLQEACDEMGEVLKENESEYVSMFEEQGVEIIHPDVDSFTAYVPALFEKLGIDISVYNDIRTAIESAS